MSNNKLDTIVISGVEYDIGSSENLSEYITSSSENSIEDEIKFMSDDNNETYAKINNNGIYAKNYYDINGNSINSSITRHPLYGKKVAVIGDSISTQSNGIGTNPYFTIKACDVGQTIQSYITWGDVFSSWSVNTFTSSDIATEKTFKIRKYDIGQTYGGEEITSNMLGTNITIIPTTEDIGKNYGQATTDKTIGNVVLTKDMIGTLQSFIPVAEDVNKTIGPAMVYNGSGTKIWVERLCEKTGATLLANASWSGSQMVCGQGEDSDDRPLQKVYSLSYSWSDYTINRCKQRDNDGNDINPDVVFIYRGTNDMTHSPLGRCDEVNLTNTIPSTDKIISEELGTFRSFRLAYIKTIQKLREKYPNVLIYCCTLNYFFRGNDWVWTRAVNYSIPDPSEPSKTIGKNITIADYNNTIREIANLMSCGIVELDKDGMTPFTGGPTYYGDTTTIGGTHPNNNGHELMAQQAYKNTQNN